MAGSVQVAGIVEVVEAAAIAAAQPTPTAASAGALAILPSLVLALTGAAVLGLDLLMDRPRRLRAAPDARTPAMIGGGFESDPLLFLSLLGMASAAALLGATTVAGAASLQFRDGVVADGLSAGSGILILLLGAVVLVAVTGRGGTRARGERRRGGEFFCLALLGSAFLVLCVQSVGLATVFVSVEALSLVVFVLASLESGHRPARPAILRTFIVSESASAGLLLGLVLLHGATGATSLADLVPAIPATAAPAGGHDLPLLVAGAAIILAALIAKSIALPFGVPLWRPTNDPASLVTIQWNRLVRIAIAVLFLRAGLSLAAALDTDLLADLVSVVATLLLVLGAWLAARQRGRTSLAHMALVHHLGFVLMAVVVELALARGDAGTLQTGVPLLFYLVAFEVPQMGAVTSATHGGPRDSRAALGFAVLLLSLGGLPPLPGFWARLILLREASATGHVYLALIAAATSVAVLHGYLALAVSSLREARREIEGAREESAGRGGPPPGTASPDPGPRLIVTLTAMACLLVGVFPETLLALCRAWALG